ncbi:MAG: replicative DNA helicase [Acidobacteria bacterium]|nr:replicative DNA helicase [Acidobacteriota bacterium]
MDMDLMFLKKTPPHSLEVEQTVLGGILVNGKNLNVVLSLIRVEDLYSEKNRTILEKIIQMADKGISLDLLSLSEALKKSGSLEDVGGGAYLSSLMDGVPKNLNIEYYARIIKEKALLRRLILSSAKIMSSSFEQKEDADQILDQAQAEIINVTEERIKPGFIPIRQLTGESIETIDILRHRKEAVTGIPSGFRALDTMTSGFHPAEFVVVAARPSMGKTAMCLNISQHVGLKTDYSVGFFSLEMAKEQLVQRLLCAEAMIDLQKVRTGFVGDREFERLKSSAETLSSARIYVDETPALSVIEMKAKARRLKMEQALDILFVDYMQLMRPGIRVENRVQEMSFISRSMKELAKELRIPVVGISQLSRAPEKGRAKPIPILSDLRESGAIEQDADVVIFIYRPEFYNPDDETLKGIAEVNIAKQRNGPTGKIHLAFLNKYARFGDSEYEPPAEQ